MISPFPCLHPSQAGAARAGRGDRPGRRVRIGHLPPDPVRETGRCAVAGRRSAAGAVWTSRAGVVAVYRPADGPDAGEDRAAVGAGGGIDIAAAGTHRRLAGSGRASQPRCRHSPAVSGGSGARWPRCCRTTTSSCSCRMPPATTTSAWAIMLEGRSGPIRRSSSAGNTSTSPASSTRRPNCLSPIPTRMLAGPEGFSPPRSRMEPMCAPS